MSTLISALSTLTGSVNNNTDVFPVLDQTISSAANRNKKARITAHNLFYSNNFTVGGLSSYGNYFGTGKDGTLTISSSAQVSASLNNTVFGDTIVKNYQDLTINSGILFSPLRPCRGMVIYCTGNLTVDGTISMTGKGGGVANKIAAPIGIASSTDSRYDLVDATLYFNNLSSSASGGRGIPTHWNWAPSGSAWFSNFKVRVPLSGSVAGGAGGIANPSVAGGVGSAGIFCCGGGGGGAGGSYPGYGSGAAGGRGTIFTGGGGGGGSRSGNNETGVAATFEAGGAGATNAGSGAGTPAGGAPGNSGGSGVGGLLILIVRGSVTINGTISSNGATGGSGIGAPFSSGGGGGSGGGRIMVIYGNTYTNVGTVVANGGSGGGSTPGGGSGGAGGAGGITVRRVHV
jgi:hypothetical protein